MRLKRQVGRSPIIALFAATSMLLLALMSTLSVPISRADNPDDPLNALMMGGTGMPTPSEFWQDTIVTDYIDPATGANYTPVMVVTPESQASTSIPAGLVDLQAAMAQQQANEPGHPYLVEGFSQSAVIAMMRNSRSFRPDSRQDIENLLVATGIQQDLLDPILGLFGPLGGLFTS